MGTALGYALFREAGRRRGMMGRDDRELVARIKKGDSRAFEELVRPYQGRLYQAILRITRNPDDAADVYQQAMLTAFEKIDDFRGDAAFKTWLFRIAVNHALMHRRSAGRSPIVAEEDIPGFNSMGGHAQAVTDWTSSVEGSAQRAELRSALSAALDALPDLDRTIVWLKDVEGLSHAEIGAATGLQVIAVRSRLHRARLRLRHGLGDQMEKRR